MYDYIHKLAEENNIIWLEKEKERIEWVINLYKLEIIETFNEDKVEEIEWNIEYEEEHLKEIDFIFNNKNEAKWKI